MTDLRTAAQQALEALEAIREADTAGATPKMVVEARKMYEPTITALKAALAEPVQEPVAWMVYTLDGKSAFVTDNPKDFTQDHRALPLYTHPPQHNPLTNEEINGLVLPESGAGTVRDLVRIIEAAHGIGEKK